MQKRLLLFMLVQVMVLRLFSQGQTAALDSLYDFSEASLEARCIRINLGDNEELDEAIRKIHTYRGLQRVQLEGAAEEEKITKLIFRLSLLKNLTSVAWIENDFAKFPESISALRFVKSMSIQGSNDLNLEQTIDKLKALPISTLSLIDNDLQKVPLNFNQLKSLQRLQISGSNQLDYQALVVQLKTLPALQYLALPFNYITDLPDNISQLSNLQVLDVSENNLFNLPGDMSALKTMNQFNIHGNLLIDPVRDLEKLKGNAIKYLSLDSDLSDSELENIRKFFPNVQIDFPLAKKSDTLAKADAPKQEEPKEGNLSVKKTYKILSPAYMVFAATMTALRYTFDTLSFDQRYLDLRYRNVVQKVQNQYDHGNAVYLRNRRFWSEPRHPRSEVWFEIGVYGDRYLQGHSELRAFSGMYWVYSGTLSKKEFSKLFVLTKRTEPRGIFYNKRLYRMPRSKQPIYWNDVRVNFDANNSLFTISLKADTGIVEFTAYPRFSAKGVETTARLNYRRFNTYQRALLTRRSQFQRQQLRDKIRYDISYNRTREMSWLGLRQMMSDEERKMSKNEWYAYYDGIIATEAKALDNSALLSGYITRALTLQGYRNFSSGLVQGQNNSTEQALFSLGNRLVHLDFVNASTADKLAVVNAYMLDPKEKSIRSYQGTAGFLPTSVWLKAYAGQVILLELRNGNWAYVGADEINSHEVLHNQSYKMKARVYDRNLDKIRDLLSEIKN